MSTSTVNSNLVIAAGPRYGGDFMLYVYSHVRKLGHFVQPTNRRRINRDAPMYSYRRTICEIALDAMAGVSMRAYVKEDTVNLSPDEQEYASSACSPIDDIIKFGPVPMKHAKRSTGPPAGRSNPACDPNTQADIPSKNIEMPLLIIARQPATSPTTRCWYCIAKQAPRTYGPDRRGGNTCSRSHHPCGLAQSVRSCRQPCLGDRRCACHGSCTKLSDPLLADF